MKELHLAFGAVSAPAFLTGTHLRLANTYREAVTLCWAARRSKHMTLATLCELTGIPPNHRSDYFDSDSKHPRDLPAKWISAVESVCGNRAISQWLARDCGLTLMEEVIEQKRAA